MPTQSITKEQFKRLVEDTIDCALNDLNPDEDGLQRLIERGGEFQAYVTAGLTRFTSKLPNNTLARSILGNDFISADEIATARGLTYTEDQLIKLGCRLPDQATLEALRDGGMMLVAGPPKSMSLIDVRAVKADFFFSKEGGWYSEKTQKFARNDKAEPVWIALCKEPVADSLSKNWSEQSELIVEPMTVPNAAEVIWVLTTYKAVRGVYLLPNLYVRTSDLDSDGGRVYVGNFDSDGLVVSHCWSDHRNFQVGVSASRKF